MIQFLAFSKIASQRGSILCSVLESAVNYFNCSAEHSFQWLIESKDTPNKYITKFGTSDLQAAQGFK
jgi:hypothetical protein